MREAANERDPIRQIADAVLYEGYILWPYSRSATKNQRRWTFGGVYPPSHSRHHADDPSEMRTECIVEGGADTRVEVEVRFLHVVGRDVMRRDADGREQRVDELEVAGTRQLSWDEAAEREVAAEPLSPLVPGARRTVAIDFPAGSDREELVDEQGRAAGAVVRSWRELTGSVEVSVDSLGPEAARLRVRILNQTSFAGGDRQQALRQTFVSTHTALRVENGAFASMTDPPEHLAAAVEGCDNAGTWPVLVGAPGSRDKMLSSPIILSDHPEVAPESPGDLFDGAEIDGLLTLSILSLTEEERREMRDSDPRAREILERTESLSEEELLRLHGAIREFQGAGP